MGRYVNIKGNAKESKRKSVNKSSLIVAIAAMNACWMTAEDFISEAMRDGVDISKGKYNIQSTLDALSGHKYTILPEFQRDELIRKKVTKTDRIVNSWSNKTIYKYRFNESGTVRTLGALRKPKIMQKLINVTLTSNVRGILNVSETR